MRHLSPSRTPAPCPPGATILTINPTAQSTNQPAPIFTITDTPNPTASTDPRIARTAEVLADFAREHFHPWCPLPWSLLHRDLFTQRAQRIHAPGTSSPGTTERPLGRSLLPDTSPSLSPSPSSLPPFTPDRRGSIHITLAPRGAAKSTLASLIFPLHAALFGLDPYILIISATQHQARQRLKNIRDAWTRHGEQLAEIATVPVPLTRCTAQALEIGATRIEAFSAGTELRGITHGPWRPTWIILDDVERSDRIRSATYRENLERWFNEVVENLGGPYTQIDVIGTLMHTDALPARLARRPDVRHISFPSIIREATDTLHWDAWRGLLHALENPDRVRDAEAYFEQHRDVMLAGSQVLWPERESYDYLQFLRETHGPAAFDKEKQNDPRAADAPLFNPDRLRKFKLPPLQPHEPAPPGTELVCDPPLHGEITGDLPRVPLADLRIFGYLDPALGRDGSRGKGDDAAIVTVGRASNGYTYVLDVWQDRVPPSEQIARLFDLHARWHYDDFGIETTAFQELLLGPLEHERKRRAAAGLPWDIPIREQRPRGDKRSRVRLLEPYTRSGWLMFNAELPERFWRQLAEFPNGRHDDGPDALAGACAMARDGLPQAVIATTRRSRFRGRGF